MSLDSNGSTFVINVPLGPVFSKAKDFGGMTNDVTKLKTSFKEHHYTAGNDLKSKKKAFMELMQAFTDSPEFEALTYDLQTEYIINVRYSINLVMNRG